MEADFNFHNKLIFGGLMLDAVRSNSLIPLEQYSEQQSTAEEGSFDKFLQGDISQQKRLAMSIMSTDVVNCYDGIHHAIMTLLFLCIGIRTGAVSAMLLSIQLMKFFLHKGGENQHGLLVVTSFGFFMVCAKEMEPLQQHGSLSAQFLSECINLLALDQKWDL